ncbi:thermonuclease family protein [Aurantimonas sp. HBX-1]|uniref:thermonuclease family protein n=1 Tax=Aurantimonas sp. HBX-1 TaxID=2906072 RepID=UPI001F3E8CB3|nr:thermonuclease family protein [Aurantimonas sp. HBX-1]UIJ71852.1 thermonuclease family protein [Aurantimonas sp. HBX-1]
MLLSRLTLSGCIIAFGLASGLSPAGAQESYPRSIAGPVEARVIKVRDGDTVEVEAFVWPMQAVQVAVRLQGIDAPEHRGKCDAEKAAAARATERLAALLGDGPVTLADISGDKYFGRVLATLSTADYPDLGKILLREGLVAPYGGGKRRDWCVGAAGQDLSAVDPGSLSPG